MSSGFQTNFARPRVGYRACLTHPWRTGDCKQEDVERNPGDKSEAVLPGSSLGEYRK